MSIDRVNISNLGIDQAQLTQANELVRSASKDRQVSTSSDSVALSPKTKELDQLATAIDHSRLERYNVVLEALKSGTYDIPTVDIAQKLIKANKKIIKR